jgi:hypothetical protein
MAGSLGGSCEVSPFFFHEPWLTLETVSWKEEDEEKDEQLSY